jgi:hypothetical protein
MVGDVGGLIVELLVQYVESRCHIENCDDLVGRASGAVKVASPVSF